MPPPVQRERLLVNGSNTYNVTKFQPHMKYCTLSLNSKTSIEYVCYTYEVCCLQGCCSGQPLKNIQSWQFWCPIIFFVVLVYFLSQFCMGAEKRRTRHHILEQHTRRRFHQNIVPVHHRVVPAEINNVDHFLDQLIEEYRVRYPDIESPFEANICTQNQPKPNGLPCYDDALLMPKPQKRAPTAKNNENNNCDANEELQNDECLPSYENATSR